MDRQIQADILRAGIAAPSADNSQPWRFEWSGDDLDVHIDAQRSGSISDTRYVLSDLATGACVENMVIRARSFALAAEIETFPREDDERWAARIRWHHAPDSVQADPLAAAIESRHTDRRFPWRGPISAQTQAQLATQAQRIPGQQLYWPDTAGRRRQALRIIRQAETLRFRSPALHAELFSSIRFAAGWRSACDEGLAPATLAVEAPMRPLFQALRHPAMMRALKRVGAATLLGWRSAALPVRLSPGLCACVAPSRARSDILACGRALQRVWLQATLAGLSVQPYAAAGVLGLGFVPVEPPLQATQSRLQADLEALCTPGHGVVFLRLGYTGKAPPVRNGRRAPDSFATSP